MAYTTEDIRNLALVGDTGVGKTLLAEALLFAAGATKQKGSLAKGSTVCDFDPHEKKLLHSLDTSFCHFESGGKTVNVADTPGFTDFVGRAFPALEAVETAAIVVSAEAGVGPMARRMMDFARERPLCRFVVVNKIDHKAARPAEILAELREIFGKQCLPLNLPAGGGTSVVDCFFQATGTPTDFSSAGAAHKELIEQVVEVDEVLMARYLEQGEELAPEQLHEPFEKALREGHLVPVVFCSAETGVGVPELITVLMRLAPNPTEGNPPPFMKGEGAEAACVEIVPDVTRHVVAHVFKIVTDPFVGKLGFLRVHQGTLKVGQPLFVGDARKPIKVSHIYRQQGKEHVDVAMAIPGDIVTVPKVEDLFFDAVVHDSREEDHHHLKSIDFPPAMLGVALEPEKHGDEQKLADALHRLVAEDPSVRVEHVGNETVLYGLGELHLRVLLERMSERAGGRLKARPPAIPYRETITTRAEGHHRHRKQTGGAGQFGEVYLRVEPLARGAGFEFENATVGGSIPFQFIPAVEKGVRRVLAEGAIAGFPFQDVRVTVYDGKSHAVDSKEVAFVAAARKAFLDAVSKASPIVLEPIVRLEVSIPTHTIGDVSGDLAGRRGRVTGNLPLSRQRAMLTAVAPLSEVRDYASALKSMTAGEGTYTLDLSHYEAAPPRRQAELCAAFKPVRDDDD